MALCLIAESLWFHCDANSLGHADARSTKYLSPNSSKNDDPQFHNQDVFPSYHDKESHLQKWQNPSQNSIIPQPFVGVQIPPKPIKRSEHGEIPFALSDLRADKSKDQRPSENVQLVTNKSGYDFPLDMDDLEIPWSALVLKERIGAGIFLFCLKKGFLAFFWSLIQPSTLMCMCLTVCLSLLFLCFPGSFGTVHRADWLGSVRFFS